MCRAAVSATGTGVFTCESVSMQHVPIRVQISATVPCACGREGGEASDGTQEAPARVCTCVCVCVCKRIYPGGSRAEPLGAAVKRPCSSQNPHRFLFRSHHSRHFLGRLFSSVSVVGLFLFGESRPRQSLLPFRLYHHPLPVRNFSADCGAGWPLPVGMESGGRAGHLANRLWGGLGTKAPVPSPLRQPSFEQCISAHEGPSRYLPRVH